MANVKCHCKGRRVCRLCGGSGYYRYDPGPRGWMPFRCPTCEGRGTAADAELGPEPCPTCRATGTVDPADPPTRGLLDVVWKSLFGA